MTAPLVLAASGCGGQDDSASDPTPGPTTDPTASTTTPPSEGLQKIRVAGAVVEVGDCVVVRDDNDTTWTIVGDLASDLVLGTRVQVTGTPDLVRSGCGGPIVKAVRVDVVG